MELLVDETIKSVFANHAEQSESVRLTTKDQVITSLGRSPSWVERYCITGLLVVPPREDSDLGDIYGEVVEVRYAEWTRTRSYIYQSATIIP